MPRCRRRWIGIAGAVGLFFNRCVTVEAQTNAVPPLPMQELRLVLEMLRTENRDWKVQVEQRETVIRNLQESLAAARTENDLLQRQWIEAQMRAQTLGANPADSEAVAVQRQLAETIRQLTLAEADRRQLLAQLERLLAAVPSNAHVSGTVEATQALLAMWRPPATEVIARPSGGLTAAKIVAVNPQLRVVVLDVGAQQGVRIGMPFEVLRGDRVVAKLRVIEVRSRICGALIEQVEKQVTLAAGETAGVAKRVETVPR